MKSSSLSTEISFMPYVPAAYEWCGEAPVRRWHVRHAALAFVLAALFAQTVMVGCKTNPVVGRSLPELTEPEMTENNRQHPVSPAIELVLQPSSVGLDTVKTVMFSATFRNNTDTPLTIYPGIARFDSTQGWMGPRWHLVVRSENGKPQQPERTLRDYYGPPGQPPSSQYYTDNATIITPGETFTSNLSACWIPHTQLRPLDVSIEILDPQAMDNLGVLGDLQGTSLLLLNSRCQSIEGLRSAPSFLRPGTLVFLKDEGPYTISLGYSQEPWIDFAPESSIELQSNTQTISVNK